MKQNSYLKAYFLLFVLIGTMLGVYYFFAPPIKLTKFSTSYEQYPLPKHRPVEEPSQIIDVPGIINSFDIAQDGEKIAIATSKELIIYNLSTLERIYSYPLEEQVSNIHFSPDAGKVAISGSIPTYYQNGHLHVSVLDILSGDIVYTYNSDSDIYDPENAIVWSPDSKKIAFSVPDHGISVIDINTGKNIASLSDFINPPIDLSWSPDGKRILATGDYGNGIRRWRLDTNQWVRLWDPALQPASSIEWSPNGKNIASGHYGGNVCIWDIQNNACSGMIHAHFNWVGDLDWSPDSTKVASASGAIRIWDISTGEMQSAFGFYDGVEYYELEWPNTNTITTLEGSYSERVPSMIRFWDITTGDVKLAFRGWDNIYSPSAGGVMLVLNDVQVGADHTIIKASLRYDTSDLSFAEAWNLTMTDSQGKTYPLKDITPSAMNRNLTRVYQTVPLPVGEHIMLDLAGSAPQNGFLMMIYAPNHLGKFTFDPGTILVGESATPNIDININNWYVHLDQVKKISPTELRFEFGSEDFYNGIELFSPSATASSTNLPEHGMISVTLTFSEMPNSPIEADVTKLFYENTGSWTLDFLVAKSMFTDHPSP